MDNANEVIHSLHFFNEADMEAKLAELTQDHDASKYDVRKVRETDGHFNVYISLKRE